jgi:hypothetical protein
LEHCIPKSGGVFWRTIMNMYAKKCEIVLDHALGMKIVNISVLNNELSVKIVRISVLNLALSAKIVKIVMGKLYH